MFSKIKQFLPGSSRSLHAMHEEIKQMRAELNSLHNRIDIADRGINGNINHKFDQVLLPKIDKIEHRQAVKAEHDRLRFEALMKDAYPNNSPSEIRLRIFSLFPEAEGDIRLMQLANARLMHELDAICTKLGIEYWTSYGSLVGTMSRDGFIPWDDDIDICMMREDVKRICQACESNTDFQITIVYDYYAKCKQVRFSSRSINNPCFIDISIYDWARFSEDNNDVFRQVKIDFVSDILHHSQSLSYWEDNPYLFDPESGFVVQCSDVDKESQNPKLAANCIQQIEEMLLLSRNKAYELGILCKKEEATGVAYSVENVFDAPRRPTIWEIESIFPTQEHRFESYSIRVPNNATRVADDCYPGWPYLPNDILGHEHFSKEILANSEVRGELLRFINQ